MPAALGAALPNCARLGQEYDVERMRAELAAFAARSGSPFSAASGRRVLPLRSVAGDPYREDSGGPSVQGFQDTHWLRHLSYFQEILRGLPAPVRAARLWAIGPGGRGVSLRTAKLGPAWGLCRLHLSVTTGPESWVAFVRERRHLPPGSLWFTAAWREYAVVNRSESELVHLIVDMFHTERVGTWFPVALRAALAGPRALRGRSGAPFPTSVRLPGRFRLPEAFANWERPGHVLYAESQRRNSPIQRTTVSAEIRFSDGLPVLTLGGRPFCGLEHIGHGEFRLRGWSDERTLKITGQPDIPVVLLLREGHTTYQIEILPDTSPPNTDTSVENTVDR